MKTQDIFKKVDSRKLNETLEKTFGQKLKLETFSIEQLEDARNRLRTQVHQFKQSAGFNETVNNDTFTKAQWMLDTINKEIAERLSVAEQNGEEMNLIKEGATDKAGAVVTAKTMVDKISRYIEELSGMENDTLLTLGDTIRDEMGQDQAKSFLTVVAPAIAQTLETLKQTRETISGGVRSLTGEQQPAELIGSEPEAADTEAPMGDEEMGPAEPDQMNAGDEEPAGGVTPDDFAASEPAAGGDEEAGRAKRESIERTNKLLKVLAG